LSAIDAAGAARNLVRFSYASRAASRAIYEAASGAIEA